MHVVGTFSKFSRLKENPSTVLKFVHAQANVYKNICVSLLSQFVAELLHFILLL